MAFHVTTGRGGSESTADWTRSLTQPGHTALLCATEPLDLAGAERLQGRIETLSINCRWLVLDLQAAEYVDSDGVRMLEDLSRALHSNGSDLLLVVPEGSRVERTLSLLHLDAHLRIFPRLEDAWADLAAAMGSGN